MTKLWVMSDLHLDSDPIELPRAPAGTAALIIAGDIADGHERQLGFLNELEVGIPAIAVNGNHDYAGHDLNDEGADGFALSLKAHLLLPGEAIEFDGIRLVGSTLWTDFALNGDPDTNRRWARGNMPDYQTIDLGMRRLRVADVEQAHQHQLALLAGLLMGRDNSRTIVVTHHAPHPFSLPPESRSAPSAGAFASDLTELIVANQPALWVHGHVHRSCDYNVGRTRIVCNARGFVRDRDGRPFGNPDFDPSLTITL